MNCIDAIPVLSERKMLLLCNEWRIGTNNVLGKIIEIYVVFSVLLFCI